MSKIYSVLNQTEQQAATANCKVLSAYKTPQTPIRTRGTGSGSGSGTGTGTGAGAGAGWCVAPPLMVPKVVHTLWYYRNYNSDHRLVYNHIFLHTSQDVRLSI